MDPGPSAPTQAPAPVTPPTAAPVGPTRRTITLGDLVDAQEAQVAASDAQNPFGAIGMSGAYADAYRTASNNAARYLARALVLNEIKTPEQLTAYLKQARVDLERLANPLSAGRNFDDFTNLRSEGAERALVLEGRYQSFTDRAFALFPSPGQVVRSDGAPVDAPTAAAEIETFRNGGTAPPDLVHRREVAVQGAEPYVIETRPALREAPDGTGSVPTVEQVRPGLGSPSAQALSRSNDALLTEILDHPAGDPAVVDKVAQWAKRTYDLAPEQRGTAWKTHVATQALLASKGFFIGDLAREPGETGFAPDRRTGQDIPVFLKSAIDLNAYVQSEDEFVARFRSMFRSIRTTDDLKPQQ